MRVGVAEVETLVACWRVLVRRRWVVYLAVATAVLVTFVGSLLSTPQYRATAVVQIEPNTPQILEFREISTMNWGWLALEQFYHTQHEIMASLPVARLAVARLGLTDHPDFSAAEVRPGLVARLAGLIPRRSRPQIPRDAADVVAESVLQRLQVVPRRDSQLVQVSWTHSDPILAAKVANAIADAYLQFDIESRYTMTDQAREFLVNQVDTLKRELIAIEDRLQEYGETKGIFSIDDSSNLQLKALRDIAERRTVAETSLAAAEADWRTAAAAPPEAFPEVLDSALIGRLRAEYAAYEAQYSEQQKLFRDGWPGVQNLKAKMDQARERLELETQRIAEQMRAAKQTAYRRAVDETRHLDGLMQDHERTAQRLKRDAIEYANLLSEARKKREMLDALLRRQNEMSLSTRLRDLEATSSNIKIVQRADPPTAPIRPRTTLNVGVGLLLGLSLGMALAFLLDQLDNTISSPAELEQALSLPVLAVIPRYGRAGASSLVRVRRRPTATSAETIDLLVHRELRSAVAEAYRGLRTALLLSNPGQPPRQILLTSALPEEGKTATTLNLAAILAQLGRRVLVVDTDLHRPRLHRVFQVENRRGVSTFLSGLEDDPHPLTLKTEVENLEFLPSGPVPPDPSQLLNSPVFARMGLVLLERGYDHILFDSAPILPVSDALIIANAVDMAILVVRAGNTPRHSVGLAAARLRQARSGPTGVVLNDLDLDRQPSAYAHDYYASYDRVAEPELPPAPRLRGQASSR